MRNESKNGDVTLNAVLLAFLTLFFLILCVLLAGGGHSVGLGSSLSVCTAVSVGARGFCAHILPKKLRGGMFP